MDNEAVRIDMPEENSFVRFHSGQYQFKVPFAIYSDFEAILESLFKVWRKRPNFMVVRFLKLPTQNESTATFPPDSVLTVNVLTERLKIL